MRERKQADKFDFNRGSVLMNLETVFGTTNPLEMLAPSTKQLDFDGFEWPGTLHSIKISI